MAKRKPRYCDFCGGSTKEVGDLLIGPGAKGNDRTPEVDCVFICVNCVDTCVEQIQENGLRRGGLTLSGKIPHPKDVYSYLENYVIGQTHAKKVLAVAVCNHYKRLFNEDKMRRKGNVQFNEEGNEALIIDKSNILLVGPTGSGKTLLCKTLAKALDVPFAIADATTLTEAGYVGEDVENVLLKLIQAADFEISKAECGIIYIDEIDKVGKSGGNVSITRDVSGEGVQQALLKILEGTVANVPPAGGRKHPDQQYMQIDTTNILFICGGSFDGVEDIIRKRIGKNKMGFVLKEGSSEQEEKTSILSQVTDDDLVQFGMIPEFVGRLPILASLEEMTEDALARILIEPKNALIKQYKTLFSYSNANLEFTKGALDIIVKKAKEARTGARALRSVIEGIMLDGQYDLPSDCNGQTFIVDEDVALGNKKLIPPSKEAA